MSQKNDEFCTNQTKKLPRQEAVTSLIEPVQALVVLNPGTEPLIPSTCEELKESFYENVNIRPENSDTAVNVVYKIVYPDDLNLKPAAVSQKSKGRPKKPKIQVEPTPPPPPQKTIPKVLSKTRSGREIKFPKHIENEFKRIEINDGLPPDSMEVKLSDFEKYAAKGEQNKLLDQLDLLQKKRRIAAQYRCPKCKKAYLGRNKILKHLKKNPTHGPMHQNEEKNFEVWNYLVNITQKCPSSERGQKFCQELSNLLHNLLLLTNALFKKLGSAANEVKIDKVLGNAIGLTPGNYYFDDNNLYKNVTVLKLMANNDFLHSIKSKTDDLNSKSTMLSDTNCNCGKRNSIDELVLRSMLIASDTNSTPSKQVNSNKILKNKFNATDENAKNVSQIGDIKKFIGDEFFACDDSNSRHIILPSSTYEVKSNLIGGSSTAPVDCTYKSCNKQNIVNKVKNDVGFNGKELTQENIANRVKNDVGFNDKEVTQENIANRVKNNVGFNGKELTQEQSNNKTVNLEAGNIGDKTFSGDEFFSSNVNLNDFSVNDYEMKQPFNSQTNTSNNIRSEVMQQKLKQSSPKIKIQSNILICPPRFFQKNVDSKSLVSHNNKNAINSELMTDNSVVISLPNLRVDELILPVPSDHSNILDNSSSSDEVMNVDQFVNERFRKITESDLEVTNSSSLNLELPSLDLFQFHTS